MNNTLAETNKFFITVDILVEWENLLSNLKWGI